MCTNATAQEFNNQVKRVGSRYYLDSIPISNKQVCNLMNEYEVSKKYWKKSKSQLLISRLLMISQMIYISRNLLSGIIATTTKRNPNNASYIFANLGVGALWTAILLSSSSSKMKAIDSYNKAKSINEVHIHIGQTNNGFGIVYSF
ncbi:MAG: hypothetical protein ACJATI_005462 [Halioglobus sp.]|jgi:hypothetical protein